MIIIIIIKIFIMIIVSNIFIAIIVYSMSWSSSGINKTAWQLHYRSDVFIKYLDHELGKTLTL